jgi:hypothetical protein
MAPRYHNPKPHNGILNRLKGQNKEQSIGTPAWFLELVYALLGNPVDLDPCDDGQRRVRARHHCVWPHEDGRLHSWAGKTVFFNPPFEDLGAFLRKAFLSWWFQGSESLGLFPIRSHRKYWKYARTASRICSLPSFAFHGHNQQAPFPLCIAYWGSRLDAFDRIFSFGYIDFPLTVEETLYNVLAMTTSDLQAQYTKAAGDARRAIVLEGIRRLPPHEITIAALEDILDEQEFLILFETPFSELFAGNSPAPIVHGSTKTVEAPAPRAKRKAPINGAVPTASLAAPASNTEASKSPRAPAATNPQLAAAISKIVARGPETGVSAQDIADELELEIKKIRPTVNGLIEDGVIFSSGKTRGTRYHLTR